MSGSSQGPEGLSPIKRALWAIEKLQARLDALERSRAEPIAIIGMACRFPGGASSPEDFWYLLRSGREAIREIPAERFHLAQLYDPDADARGAMYMRTGGFLDQVDGFDAEFFRISPREAVQMDPQQRLFLEVSWEALENAGVTPERLSGSRTGVFAGILSNDYAHLPGTLAERIDPYYYPGINGSFVAGRLSYFLGLHGPSVTIDTACSSSLVAVHLACQSLRLRESETAIAGGVNLILSPEISMFLCKAGVMSPTGRCRAFDRSADGMVRGEGCGVVVLKRLSDAVAEDDAILAVIRGSAVNHDGASGGLTVPNPRAQEALYRIALQEAGVRAEEVSYVETHGTGTHLGDPVELEGLSAAYCSGRSSGDALRIGSVKTNIGHTDSAAGVANLIKTVLILEHGEIPPSLHFTEPNPEFRWDLVPIAVARELAPLPEREGPALAGVSSFGLSGVNAHMILQQWRATPSRASESPCDGGPYILPLSARTPEALRGLAASFRRRLSEPDTGENNPLGDICRVAGVRRAHFECRLAAVGTSREEVAANLEAHLRGEAPPSVAMGDGPPEAPPRIVFIFSGQGPQWWAMGRELLRGERVFRDKLEEVDALFRHEAGWSILDELTAEQPRSRIDDTEVAQPAMFSVQVGLAELWRHLGVAPLAVVGHSMGEVAAAHVAGVLSLPDAVRVIYHRGRLLERATGLGKMAAVGLSIEDAREIVERTGGRVSIAAHNGPGSVVLSGETGAMDDILALLRGREVFERELRVKFASHCPQMEPFQREFEESLRGVRAAEAGIPLYSTVTGRLAENGDYTPAYWARNIRETVLFAGAMREAIEEGYNAFLEIDPHPVLAGSLEECLEASGRIGWVLHSLHRDRPEKQALLESLGRLYVLGHHLDFGRIHPGPAHPLALPNYPWQRRRFWLGIDRGEGRGPRAEPPLDRVVHPLLGHRIESPLADRQYRSVLSVSSPSYLRDHRVSGRALFPASGYLVMALAAARAEGGARRVVENLVVLRPLFMPEEPRAVQTVLEAPDERRASLLKIFSARDGNGEGPWTLHATASAVEVARGVEPPDVEDDLPAIRQRCERVEPGAFYGGLARRGYEYGESFRGIRLLWARPGEALSEVAPPADSDAKEAAEGLHPAQLDACLHSVLAALEYGGEDSLHIPVGVERFDMAGRVEGAVWAHVTLRTASGKGDSLVTADIDLLDPEGRRLGEIAGLTLRRADSLSLSRAATDDWCYEVHWRRKEIVEYAPGSERPGTWLLLADAGPVGKALAGAMEAQRLQPILVRAGDALRLRDAGPWMVDPTEPEHLRKVFAELKARKISCVGILHAWALEASPLESVSPEGLWRDHERLCGGLLHLLQAALGAGRADPPRLWIVTRGAQPVGKAISVSATQASLLGLARVIALEHPELGCVCLDLDPAEHGDQSGLVLREIRFGDGESQVAFREGRRHVARLARRLSAALPDEGEGPARLSPPRRVGITAYGVLDNLVLEPMKRIAPGPGEVEIRVRATGMNFRDVLGALGMLEQHATETGIESAGEMPFGFECAGTVVRIGPGVEGLREGDGVIAALATGSLGSFVNVRSQFVVRKPADLGFEEAATLPIAFLTARAALHLSARIRQGDRVLIHCAAGGVGQAAVQMARRAGAEVFATASPGKWDAVRALGVRHVMSSRTLDFAEEIRDLTGGEGVDIVLNSLSGEFIASSLGVCAEGGRFVEIGKRATLDMDQARACRPGVAYTRFDLEELAREDPVLVGAMLREVVEEVSRGILSPLPYTVFPLEDSVGAFRHMAQARHVGKIVIAQPDPSPDASGLGAVRGDGSYLVAGGLGGLGLRIARRLAQRGARHLLLVGRSAPSEEARRIIGEMESAGAQVRVAAADMSRPGEVATLLAEVRAEMPPLRGLIHAAAVLDDGLLLRQTLERFRRVLAPKVLGAWNLHEATRDSPLDFFVCFSSTAALLGSPGQGNYAAANAFMDALAHYRRTARLPGLSINWGPWAEVGLAAGLSGRDKARWAARGVSSIPLDEGLDLLERLLAQDSSQVGVLPVNWSRYVQELPGDLAVPFLEEVAPVAAPSEPQQQDFLARLTESPAGSRRDLLAGHVRCQVARVLGLASAERIRPRERLFDLGLDSLMAVELKNKFERSLRRRLRATLVFDHPTVEALVNHLGHDVLALDLDGERARESAGADSRSDVPSQSLEGLSEEQLADLLARELSEGDRETTR